jgi:hypothetical protein
MLIRTVATSLERIQMDDYDEVDDPEVLSELLD